VFIALGAVYIFDLEVALQTWTSPLDTFLKSRGISTYDFGAIMACLGIGVLCISFFLTSTDLKKSRLTGRYHSSLGYQPSVIMRVMQESLALTKQELEKSQIVEVDPNTFDADLAACMRGLDELMLRTLRLDPVRFSRFYQDTSNIQTELSLFLAFDPVKNSDGYFEFTGFGTVTDKVRGRISECALVTPISKISEMHNRVRVKGIRHRLALWQKGIVVSIEIQQLIDPFNQHPELRILLVFRLQRRLDGWKLSEGLFLMWDKKRGKFLPTGWTHDLSAVS
jgi:hypothetical protein